jgi:hypothetical protein
MNLRKTLTALITVIADEAAKSESFRTDLERALSFSGATVGGTLTVPPASKPRKGGRRTSAVLDPVELAKQGEGGLRTQLTALNLEQLRDIVAQYGMDPGKLVMKWKDPQRVVDRIVELALARATKGDAFRGE